MVSRVDFGKACLAWGLYWLLLTGSPAPAAADVATCVNSGAGTATTWSPWECVFEVEDRSGNLAGRGGYLNRLKVRFSEPYTWTRTGYAAWDGTVVVAGRTKHRFVLRHFFETPGNWTWGTICETPASCGSDKTEPSLGSFGQVTVTAYSGTNRLQKYGPLKLGGYSWKDESTWRNWGFLRQTTLPEQFTWVGDSAWAAPMKATDAEWAEYLNDRSARQISVIQIGPAPAWAGATDRNGQAPFVTVSGCTIPSTEPVEPTLCHYPNVAYWQAFERKIKAANERGLYIFLAGVMEPRSDHPRNTGPQHYPAAAEAVNFAHWLSARLGHCFVVFSPGFDSNKILKGGQYLQSVVGQEISRVNPLHLVTNHWSTNDISEIAGLHSERWLAFEMFQSGHNEGDTTKITRRAREMAWQISGSSSPPVSSFAGFIKPTINGEAVYDQGGYFNGQPDADFSDYRARQAGYLSWLSGAAGYSFGVGGIWDWGLFGADMADGWRSFRSAMVKDSAKSMQYMAKLMRKYRSSRYLDTYRQDLIILDPNNPLPEERKMVLGRTANTLLAYLPHNDRIAIKYKTGAYSTINPYSGMLYDPKNGCFETVASDAVQTNVSCSAPDTCTWFNRFHSAQSPSTSDRILELTSAPARIWESDSKRSLQVLAGQICQFGPSSLYGWLLDSNSQPMGIPFPIWPTANVEVFDPAVSHNGTGDFLVVWQARSDKTGVNLGVFGQRITSSGAIEGAAFQISPPGSAEVGTPAVALDQDGNAVVAWRSFDPSSGHGEIWARSVSRTNQLEQVQLVAGGVELDCSQPKVVMSRRGSLTAAWVERNEKLEQEEVRLRHFGAARLATFPSSERVNGVAAPGFSLLNLHLADSGTLEVEYEARFGPQSGGTYVQAFEEGMKVGEEVLLAAAVPNFEGQPE